MSRFRFFDLLDKRIARDMLVVMSFALAGKLAGAAKEIAVAWRYGLSEVVDAYTFVFNIVNLPVSIAFSVLAVVFIPLASRLRRESREALLQFRSQMFGAMTAVGLALGAMCYLLLPFALDSSLISLSHDVRGVAVTFSRWLAVLIPLGLVIQFASVLLMSESRHRNTLFEAVPSVAILTSVVLVPVAGGIPLAIGATVGYVTHLFALTISLARQGGLRWPSFSFQSPSWSPFLRALRFVLIAQVLQAGAVLIDQLFAARLETGALATLGYSERILSLVVALGATAVARATLPAFSNVDGRAAVIAAGRWSKLMFLAGVCAIIVGWPLAEALVAAIFERGAFSTSDTDAVAAVLRYGFVQLPFYFAALVLIQILFSQRNYALAACVAAGNVLTKLVAAMLLVPTWGLQGLMLSSAAMYAVSLLALSILLRSPYVWTRSYD